MDAETSSAIVEFQITHARVLLTTRFDGRIDPANYKNRRLHSGAGKRYMAITYLHFMATDAAVMQGHHDYIQALANMDPELARIIDMAVISH